jgi:hypothetical protein
VTGAAMAAVADFNGGGHPDWVLRNARYQSNSHLVYERQRFHMRLAIESQVEKNRFRGLCLDHELRMFSPATADKLSR